MFGDCDGVLTADDDSVVGSRIDDDDCDGVPVDEDCDDPMR